MSIEISAGLPEQADRRPWWYAEILGATALGALSVLAGAVVAVVWRYLAPPVQGVVTISGGQKAAYYEDPETKGFVGQDGVFAICAVIVAVLLALAAFFWFRKRAPIGAALAVGGGGIGAAYFAAWFGIWLGPGRGSIIASAQGVQNNGVFDLPLRLGATGVIWLWPAVAIGLYFLLMLVFGPNDPEPEDDYEAFPQWADPVDLTAPAPTQVRGDVDEIEPARPDSPAR
jgi:hypothetical protein